MSSADGAKGLRYLMSRQKVNSEDTCVHDVWQWRNCSTRLFMNQPTSLLISFKCDLYVFS